MENPKYDYSQLNYIDMTKQIKAGVNQGKHPISLMYSLGNPDKFDYDENENLLEKVLIDGWLLKLKYPKVIEHFLEFRG